LERLGKIIGVIGFSVAFTIYLALVGRGVLLDEINLETSQWYVVFSFSIGILLIAIPIWLPVFYDALELRDATRRRPLWLSENRVKLWLVSILSGLVVCIAILAFGYWSGNISAQSFDIPSAELEEFLKYFMISVTIIVVAVPEGLAMSVTLSLAYSMKKMAASNNLVRRMHACETIGAATVICSDKTGTLTQNEMQVERAHFNFLNDSSTLNTSAPTLFEQLVIEAVCANTTAQLNTSTQPAKPIGNPTEGSLLLWLHKQGIDYLTSRDQFKIHHQWTFTTERKFMATRGDSNALDKPVLHVTGAPDILLDRCTSIYTPGGIISIESFRPGLEKELKEYQSKAMRTLAFAIKREALPDESSDIALEARDLTWLGFVAIADPVREEVPDAVAACTKAGIMVKIGTGDIKETALQIGKKIGLIKETDSGDVCLTGQEFGELSDEEASQKILTLKILSRARPLDKLRLVKLLQKKNQVVAVTGDGTNDAPALNHANVGLAMGKTGTAVAKEASDIVLLDDSFSSIVNAVMWGRSLYLNIQKFVLFQLTINVTALGIAFIGPFIGIRLPLTVIQMLWINLIMDTFAALALATEPPNRVVLDKPPRHPDDFIISPLMKRQIVLTGGLFFAGIVWYLLQIQADGTVSGKELTYLFTVFVFLQFWNLFNAKCLGSNRSVFANLFENKSFLLIAVAIFIGQIVIVQFGRDVFRTVPLSLQEWSYIVLGTSAVLWIGEIIRLAATVRNRKG